MRQGGSGVEAFVEWSTSEPGYVNHGDIIRRRWNSLDMKAGAITARTLVATLPKEMRREATELLSRAAPEEDFPDDVEGRPVKAPKLSVWDE